MTRNGTTVFRNGERLRRPSGTGRARPWSSTGDRMPRSSPEGDLDGLDVAGGTERRPRRAACCCPGSSTPTCTRCRAASSGCAATSPRRTTREDYLRIVAEYAAAHPELPWILGGGWAMAAFPGGTPTAADLDAWSRTGPVFLPNRDHHGAWVNSRALRDRRHRRDTPDPPTAASSATPTAARPAPCTRARWPWSSRHCPPTTDDENYAGLLEGQRYLHSLGVTAWQDAIVGAYAGMRRRLPDVPPRPRRAAT